MGKDLMSKKRQKQIDQYDHALGKNSGYRAEDRRCAAMNAGHGIGRTWSLFLKSSQEMRL